METSPQATPVYVPYATLITALETLRTHGIPRTGRIDKTIWDTQSGAVRAQLLLGFRFLGLIDEQRSILPPLRPLVEATGEEQKALLKAVIEDKYRDILSLDLTTISQGQMDEAFRKFGVSGSTLVRATRFFIKACTELGIPIAKRFSERSKPTGPRKKKTTNGAASPKSTETIPADAHRSPSAGSTWEEKLLEKFPTYDPSWPDDLKAKWFAGFERLMKSKG